MFLYGLLINHLCVCVCVWLTFEPDPDYSPDPGTGLLSPISYALQYGILLRRENPTYVCLSLAAARHGFKMVLFTASRGNTFVGGKCALASALLVLNLTAKRWIGPGPIYFNWKPVWFYVKKGTSESFDSARLNDFLWTGRVFQSRTVRGEND